MTESLRALNQKDSLRLDSPPAGELPPGGKESRSAEDEPKGDGTTDSRATATTSLRRKARLTDFARVLPPKNAPEEEPASPETAPPAPESAAVVPTAFPVVGTAGSVLETKPMNDADSVTAESAAPVEMKESPASTASEPNPTQAHPVPGAEEEKPPVWETATPASLKDTTRVTLPERFITPANNSSAPAALDTVPSGSDAREKREFILANGERIFGHVLSETADTIYLEHQTLGVLTLPRLQIAGKPIEVILINGDRIVGDLIAETTECLYIRHASLGMLTVPHSQRSTRVVEAILKDGDRILGEVLAETGDFTVIRSATLGTVAVQHEQVAMLNRKLEQTNLRALPGPALDNTKPDPAAS